MSWHFGGPVSAAADYRDKEIINQIHAAGQDGALVLGMSRLGKTSLLYRIAERMDRRPKEAVIQVSWPERALGRIEQAGGMLLLDEAQQLREWKVRELRRLRELLEDRPFLIAAHPSLFRGSVEGELRALTEGVPRVRLKPLGEKEARRMIRRDGSTVPGECEPAVVEAIYRATGGFPNLIAGLCLHLTDDGTKPLRAPLEADLRDFVRTDIGGDAFQNIYDSLPPHMQEVLNGCRAGRQADLGVLREYFLVSGESAEFSASLFARVWGPGGTWSVREGRKDGGSQPASSPVDFCIITALEEERDAVLSLLPDHRQLDRDGSGPHTYFEASVKTKRADGALYRVIVTCLSNMGPIPAANKANAISERWNPRHVLVVGIGGGLTSEVALGDVMVASAIADYTLGKERNRKQREIRWVQRSADANLFDAANNFANGWQELTGCERPEEGTPQRRAGIIASGGDVIASRRPIDRFRVQYPKLIGVEMEGGGVAAALHERVPPPPLLMIRGVSDLADGEQNTETKVRWRKYACHVAAAYAIGLLRQGPVPGAGSHAPAASLGIVHPGE